jgi:hypothetical protein
VKSVQEREERSAPPQPGPARRLTVRGLHRSPEEPALSLSQLCCLLSRPSAHFSVRLGHCMAARLHLLTYGSQPGSDRRLSHPRAGTPLPAPVRTRKNVLPGPDGNHTDFTCSRRTTDDIRDPCVRPRHGAWPAMESTIQVQANPPETLHHTNRVGCEQAPFVAGTGHPAEGKNFAGDLATESSWNARPFSATSSPSFRGSLSPGCSVGRGKDVPLFSTSWRKQPGPRVTESPHSLMSVSICPSSSV